MELYTDVETKQYMWDVIDFDLTKFATGPSDPAIVAIKVIPTRVEISQSFGHQNIPGLEPLVHQIKTPGFTRVTIAYDTTYYKSSSLRRP